MKENERNWKVRLWKGSQGRRKGNVSSCHWRSFRIMFLRVVRNVCPRCFGARIHLKTSKQEETKSVSAVSLRLSVDVQHSWSSIVSAWRGLWRSPSSYSCAPTALAGNACQRRDQPPEKGGSDRKLKNTQFLWQKQPEQTVEVKLYVHPSSFQVLLLLHFGPPTAYFDPFSLLNFMSVRVLKCCSFFNLSFLPTYISFLVFLPSSPFLILFIYVLSSLLFTLPFVLSHSFYHP